MANTQDLNKLAVYLGELLEQHNVLLATAESCTGGWVAQLVTSVPGSSAWFERGFVTYTNTAKREMLEVSNATLENFGAVSEETAREMALGALMHSHAQVSLAVSGIAGPAGGTSAKPVGSVCFAWAGLGRKTYSHTRYFSGDRASIRQLATGAALQGMLNFLLDSSG